MEFDRIKIGLLGYRIGYELPFINEPEKASITDFFIPVSVKKYSTKKRLGSINSTGRIKGIVTDY